MISSTQLISPHQLRGGSARVRVGSRHTPEPAEIMRAELASRPKLPIVHVRN